MPKEFKRLGESIKDLTFPEVAEYLKEHKLLPT